ncbi:MAG: GtrA family protein [Bacteroidetes bacterium]|nr:GtrA family protein [Bacteroidota bacterium]
MNGNNRRKVLSFIDFFHKPFAKWINQQTFRYLACGGSNAMLDVTIYYISYHFILNEEVVHWAGLNIKPHVLAFVMSFSISFPLGFALSKFLVFPESNLRGRIQLFRYAVLVGMCIILNYVFIRLFVEVMGLYPTPSKILTTGLVAIFSYVSQRNFTFKVKEARVAE